MFKPQGHLDAITCVVISPDGKSIATASWDKLAKIWNFATGECLMTLWGHTKHLYTVAWSPDGTQIVSGSGDMTAKIC